MDTDSGVHLESQNTSINSYEGGGHDVNLDDHHEVNQSNTYGTCISWHRSKRTQLTCIYIGDIIGIWFCLVVCDTCQTYVRPTVTFRCGLYARSVACLLRLLEYVLDHTFSLYSVHFLIMLLSSHQPCTSRMLYSSSLQKPLPGRGLSLSSMWYHFVRGCEVTVTFMFSCTIPL